MKTYRGRPFSLVGVNSDADQNKARTFEKRLGITWPSFADGGTDGPIARRWQIQSWPATFLIDHRGRIRYRDLRGEEEERRIAQLVAEAEKAR